MSHDHDMCAQKRPTSANELPVLGHVYSSCPSTSSACLQFLASTPLMHFNLARCKLPTAPDPTIFTKDSTSKSLRPTSHSRGVASRTAPDFRYMTPSRMGPALRRLASRAAFVTRQITIKFQISNLYRSVPGLYLRFGTSNTTLRQTV
jgi:hypothetical protein